MIILLHILSLFSILCLSAGLYLTGQYRGEQVGWKKGMSFMARSRARKMPFAYPRDEDTLRIMRTTSVN